MGAQNTHRPAARAAGTRNTAVGRIGFAAMLAAAAALLLVSTQALAGPREQAKRIHDRIAGVPPSAALLDQMARHHGRAPFDCRQPRTRTSAFYNVTLKNFVTPWTNRDQTVFVPLNDYTATVIGMVRDDVPFNTVLSADILYVGGCRPCRPTRPTNNNLYQQMEDQDVDLSDRVLVATTQSAHTGLPAGATAGVMTTRAAAQAFFIAGTNRAMFRFTMMNHMCKDMEQVHDVHRAAGPHPPGREPLARVATAACS